MSNRSPITVYVPPNNVVGDEDSELIAIAKSSYFFDEERDRIIKIDCEQKPRRSIPTMLYDH